MKYLLTTVSILISLSFVLSACGRRGTLEKPSGEGVYPRTYPAPESYPDYSASEKTDNTNNNTANNAKKII